MSVFLTGPQSVDSRRNLIVVRTGQDDLVTYSPLRLKTATNDSRVYRPELQPIAQGERIRIIRNDKELNVRAGDFATVTRTEDEGGLRVRLDSGKRSSYRQSRPGTSSTASPWKVAAAFRPSDSS